jgi:putative oxidoreductase
MTYTLTALRLVIGGLFVGHGLQKLTGGFGGHGLEATGKVFDSLGLKPGPHAALAAGISEAGGGALLAAGLATPLAGAALTGTMVHAVRTVHAPNGPWVTDGGWEYNVVLIAAVLAIVEHGPGPISGDALLGEHKGFGWALAALAAGLSGPSLLMLVLGRGAEDEPEPEPVAE